jgi:hypothetical protein
MGRVVLRPMNMTAFDVDTGKALNVPDPTLAPANTGGLGDGGGDPNNAPAQTKPDKLAAPVPVEERAPTHLHVTPSPDVHVASPNVTVTPADVHVDVEAPNVPVEAAFSVQAARAPDVRVDVAAPDVHVAAPDVQVTPNITVEPAAVTQRLIRRKIIRDRKTGRITEVVEEFID